MDNQETSPSKLPITEATIVGILGISAYLLAFIYEYAYLSKFGIPAELIRISLEQVFIVILIIGSFFLGVLFLSNILFMIMTKYDNIKPFLYRWLFYFVYLSSLLFFYRLRKKEMVLCIILISFLLIVEVILPLIFHRKEKSFVGKLIASDIAEQRATENDLWSVIIKNIGLNSFRIILFYIITISITFNAGVGKAELAKEYYLLADNPNIIVLKMSSDMLICVPYDASSKKIKDTFMIYKLGPKDKYEFVRQKIGPLNFEKPQM